MKDCNKDIENYHAENVKLSKRKRDELRERRDTNRVRVKDGLKRNGDPSPLEFIKQGSDAMGTTISEPANKYDIDDGVIFAAVDLLGANGAAKPALDARSMVRDALD